MFRDLEPGRQRSRRPAAPAPEIAALPALAPYERCKCGKCRECHDNEKWDRVFAKFEVKETEMRGLYGCALVDL
jgi:hypothetical protein